MLSEGFLVCLLATAASAATFVTGDSSCPDTNADWLWWALIWIAGVVALMLLAGAVFFFIRRRRRFIDTTSYSIMIEG